MARNIGQNIRRRGSLAPATPAGGAINSAVTVTGDVSPAGAVVETAWGVSNETPPVAGWGAATVGAGLGATFSRVTTRPAAGGTYWLWARRRDWPRTVGVAPAPTVVT
jgi:hypothetical protein